MTLGASGREEGLSKVCGTQDPKPETASLYEVQP